MGFRLIPPKSVPCHYCPRLFRTWAGLESHLTWGHTIRISANAIICVTVLLLCIVAVIIGELFY